MALELESLLNSYNFFRDSICCPKCTKHPKSEQSNNYNKNISRLGIKDEFIHHGTQEELWKECGINSESIVKKVELILKKNQVSQAG